MNRSHVRGALASALALALLVPGRNARADYAPELHLLPEGAMPELQLMPELVEAKKKKKKTPPPDDSTTPAPEQPTPAPNLATPDPAPAAPPAPVPVVRDVPAATPSAPSSGSDMGFDLLGEAKPHEMTPEELHTQHAAEVRRRVLTAHQAVGLATLGLLAGTVVVGQLNYSDKFGGGAPNNTARFETFHEVLAYSTLTGFAATGVMGLLAPVPYDKPVKVDTTLVHKICMGAATLGMMTELGYGLYTASREGYLNQKSVAQVHQVIGYTTLGFMSAGASAFLF